MELRQLRSFMSVARQNSFRRGASALNIAQPAVSRQIKQLEASLGVELFHRTNTGILLTEAGQALLHHAEELFVKLAQIREDLSEISLRVTGTVRIGAPSSIGELLFAPVAQRARHLAPALHLAFTESSCRLIGLLQSGHIDLAVFSCTRELNEAEWTCQKLVGERVYLIGNPDALEGQDSIKIEQVIAMPLILTPLPNAQHRYLFEVARECGRKLNIVAEAESMAGLMALVNRGLGLGVLPFSAASLIDHGHPVGRRQIIGFYSWRTLVRRADVALSPAGQRAWDMIISEMEILRLAGAFGTAIEADQAALPAVNIRSHATAVGRAQHP